MSRNYDRVHGHTAAPPPLPTPPYSFSYLSQQPPDLSDESDTSPAVASPLTPNWADQLPDLSQDRLHDWDQAKERDFQSRNAGRFRIAGVPTLIRPQPKGLSMALTAESFQSTLSQHRPSPSEISFSGGAANFANLGSSFGYSNFSPSSNISLTPDSRNSRHPVSDDGSLPSLDLTNMTESDGTSVSINMDEVRLGYPTLLEEHNVLVDNRNLQPSPPPGPAYECAFWFLDCGKTFYSISEWKTHCLSHFKGEAPPVRATCPLCAESFSGRDAWNRRMNHVLEEHHSHGYGLEGSRPDFDLFKWLWKKRIIDDATLKDLEGHFHTMRSEGLSSVTEGRARESRREPWLNRRHI